MARKVVSTGRLLSQPHCSAHNAQLPCTNAAGLAPPRSTSSTRMVDEQFSAHLVLRSPPEKAPAPAGCATGIPVTFPRRPLSRRLPRFQEGASCDPEQPCWSSSLFWRLSFLGSTRHWVGTSEHKMGWAASPQQERTPGAEAAAVRRSHPARSWALPGRGAPGKQPSLLSPATRTHCSSKPSKAYGHGLNTSGAGSTMVCYLGLSTATKGYLQDF